MSSSDEIIAITVSSFIIGLSIGYLIYDDSKQVKSMQLENEFLRNVIHTQSDINKNLIKQLDQQQNKKWYEKFTNR